MSTPFHYIFEGFFFTIGGSILTALAGMIAHRSKRIPYKIIKMGNNGSSLITATELKENCKRRHEPEQEKLAQIFDRQTEVIKQMTLQGERLAHINGFIEGKFK